MMNGISGEVKEREVGARRWKGVGSKVDFQKAVGWHFEAKAVDLSGTWDSEIVQSDCERNAPGYQLVGVKHSDCLTLHNHPSTMPKI
jgi:hypothetical protein